MHELTASLLSISFKLVVSLVIESVKELSNLVIRAKNIFENTTPVVMIPLHADMISLTGILSINSPKK